MADIEVLDVLLHDRPVGTLTRFGGDRTLFAFNDDYIEDPERATLGLHFKDEYGALITDFRPRRTRVMPFFSNLLPEGRMREYLAARARVKPDREFYLLWVLGRDLPGALKITPADGEDWPPATASGRADDDHDPDHYRETALRFSLAGVQLKFSALAEATGGLTIPAQGTGGSWIVKLPSSVYAGVPENEYAMLRLADLVGIDVPETRLIDVAAIGNLPEGIGEQGGSALAIKRFDRLDGGGAVHIEDFAQVFGIYPEDKYNKISIRNIAAVLAMETAEADIVEFIRRLVFNTLIGNADMHAKNWSLMYPDSRTAALAPAYDFVATIAYLDDPGAALRVSRTSRFDAFSADELSHLAARAMLPEALVLRTARETVERFREHWSAEKHHLPVTSDVVRAIDRHLGSVPLASSNG